MPKWSHLALPSLALLAAVLASGGCSPSSTENHNPPPVFTVPPPGGSGMPPGGDAGQASGLKPLMMRIGGRGPDALWPKINSDLNTNSPPWDDLQAQAKEFADVAAKVGANNPPKGSKESWDQHANEFTTDAVDLAAAAQAKDVDKAKAAQMKVNNSCRDCHMAHRGGRGG